MEWLIVLLAAIVLVAIAVVVIDRSRSWSLRRRFGPEYERAVIDQGGRRRAEASLRGIARRRDALDVRHLTPDEREGYLVRWREVQLRFVDDPADAVGEADALVTDVLTARGYPGDDAEERVAMVSVDHPDAVDGYRVACAIHAGEPGRTATIDQRRDAFVRYRALFERLVGAEARPGGRPAAADEVRGAEAGHRSAAADEVVVTDERRAALDNRIRTAQGLDGHVPDDADLPEQQRSDRT